MVLILLLCLMLSGSVGEAQDMPRHTLDEIHFRDPFILPVKEEGKYYLFGTGWTPPDGPGFATYTSTDLATWEGPQAAFQPPEGFSSNDYWAPEVHPHKNKFYMFATFWPKAQSILRHTRILASDKPGGPYRFHSDGPVTPENWWCLDGTLFIDESGAPWMVFCHEWIQVGDGEICAVRLSDDLKRRVSEPILLFKASEAPWVVESGSNPRGRVTDGPFLHRTADGTLLMLWSSFGQGGYKLAVARSASGKLEGPWVHEPKPLYENDGGHGMLFRGFDGTLMLTLHQPNGGGNERPRLFVVEEKGGKLENRGQFPALLQGAARVMREPLSQKG